MLRSALWLSSLALLAGCNSRAQPGADVVREETAPSATAATAAPPTASAEVAAPTPAEASAAPTASAPRARASVTAAPDPSARTAKSPDPPASASAPAPVATAEPAAPPVQGTAVSEGAFRTWMQGPAKQKAGVPGAVDVVLTASGDYHCNEKYPYRFKLDAPPAGVTYPEPVVRTISIGAARSVMRVPFVAATPGEVTISGTFSFSVCTSSQCVIDSRKVAVRVKIEG